MINLGLKKNVEIVTLTGEPGAKKYAIEFTDNSIEKMYDALLQVKDHTSKLPDDATIPSDDVKTFIVAVAGEEFYDDAMKYIDEAGVGAKGNTYASMQIVSSLADLVIDHMNTARSAKLDRYLASKDEAV